MGQKETFKHHAEGSSPNARSRREGEEGWTPLMYEADRGYGQSLRVLFLHHPDPNLRNDAGETALMIASRKGNHAVFKELIIEFGLAEKTLEMNAVNKEGKTALMIAAENGHTECVSGLTNHGADPNLQDKDGKTALICAVQAKQAACVANLLKHPLNPMLKDKAGKNAIDYALEAGEPQVIATLEAKRHEYLAALGESIDNEGLLTGKKVPVSKPFKFKKGPAA
jgi:ankyrin repeat protein